jgi:hypothetical protein
MTHHDQILFWFKRSGKTVTATMMLNADNRMPKNVPWIIVICLEARRINIPRGTARRIIGVLKLAN